MKKVRILLLLLITIFIGLSPVFAVMEEYGPVGIIQLWSSDTIPNGYLVADGRAISRTTYSKLFAVIGTHYGSGDGSTTFNLPNLSGKVPVGLNTNDSSFSSLGKTGGTKEETLTVDQIPSHTHIQNAHTHMQEAHTHIQEAHNHTQQPHTHIQNAHNHSQNAHNHSQNAHTHGTSSGYNFSVYKGTRSSEAVGSISGSGYQMSQVKSGGSWGGSGNVGSATAGNVATTATNIASTAANNLTTATNQETTATNKETAATNNPTIAINQNTGGGKAHTNLQPYQVFRYIIKYE